MTTQIQEVTDTRWNDDSRPGGDATKAAISIARVWRGYILCVYLDNDKNSDSVWTTIYDPYTHDRWIGSQKIPLLDLPGYLTSAAPPSVAYINLNTIIVTAAPGGQTLLSLISYPMNADSPDDFKKIPPAHPGSPPASDLAVPARPALINFNDKLVFVYRNKANSLVAVIGMMNAQQGISWSPAHPLGAVGGTDGPSLTIFQGRLFCAYTAQGGQIMVASSADGISWNNWSPTGAVSAYGPALSADPLGSSLILMYADGDSKKITTRNSGDGHAWSAPEKCNGATQDAPALTASAAGLMLAVYRGSDNDNVYYATTKAGLWNYVPAAAPSAPPAAQSTLSVGAIALGDTMKAGDSLSPGHSLKSANGAYTLTLQTDGNLVLYKIGGVVLWASTTNGKAITSCVLEMDGRFVLLESGSRVDWQSGGSPVNGSHLIVQNDGNVVIYRPDGPAVWATNTQQK